MRPEVRVGDVLVRGNELVEALEDEENSGRADRRPLCPRLRVDAAAACAAAGGRAARLSVGEEAVRLSTCWRGHLSPARSRTSSRILPPAAPYLKIDAADDAAILSMIIGGMGVSVLSSLSLIGFEDRVRGIPLREPIECELGVAVRSSRTASAPVRAFINFLMQQCQLSRILKRGQGVACPLFECARGVSPTGYFLIARKVSKDAPETKVSGHPKCAQHVGVGYSASHTFGGFCKGHDM